MILEMVLYDWRAVYKIHFMGPSSVKVKQFNDDVATL